MALTVIYQPILTKVDTIELDASISESHVGEVEVTEHPVEEGANISDHARPKPETLSVEGVVSNTPLSRSQSRRAFESHGRNLETTTLTDEIQGQPGFAESAYAKLLFIKDTGKVVTVVTKLRTYNNMVLKSLNVPRNAQTGEILRFTAQFLQVKVVQNKFANLPPAFRNTPKGKKVARPDPKPEEPRSWLKSGTDATGITKHGSGLPKG